MYQAEQELFWHLCRFLNPNRERIAELLQSGAGTPVVLGRLLYNRMAGVAYHVLLKTKTTDSASREFRNTLRDIWLMSIQKNESYTQGKILVTEILEKSGAEYALLKGAFLCDRYPSGCRTANDVDVLTEGKWITAIGQSLSMAGFRQGYIQDGKFAPASREKIIRAKMLRGETVPYFLEVDLPFMRYLEVDINFSLDYKNTAGSALPAFISQTKYCKISDGMFRTLCAPHFILHLCMHLYKEATTYPWIQMGRDMSLYKYCDLYMLLREYTLQDYVVLTEESQKHGLLSQCYYALEATRALFGLDDSLLVDFLTHIKPKDERLMDRVIDPAGKKEFLYTVKDMRQRFFIDNRVCCLKEVECNE